MIRMGSNFLRALGYSLMPRALGLALLPMVILTVMVWVMGHFFWEPAQALIRQAWSALPGSETWVAWIPENGRHLLSEVMAPVVVIGLITPLLIVASLLMVSLLAAGPLVRWVARRRFGQLGQQSDWSWWRLALANLGLTAMAGVMLILSLPLWLIPPLGLVCPALILGWLTHRVMVLDVLSEWASQEECSILLQTHRWQWLAMGVVSGLLGALPSLLWSSMLWFAALFVVLAPLAMWAYTWVFVLTTLWFAHHGLQALEALRARTVSQPSVNLPPQLP